MEANRIEIHLKNQLAATITLLLLAVGHISATTLYVDSKSSNPRPPYSSWATAANNVQDAVNAAPSGALVLVNDGVYSGGVVVGAPLVLMSVNGAQSTFIDGGGTNRCLNLTNNTWVSGFTFTNGYADKGAGVWGAETNCFITNCVVTGNSAGTGGGSYSGTFYNCLFTGNAARGNGQGGAAFNSTLYNCTVSGNSAAEAGGVFQSTLYNSIVYDNSAPTNANYSSGTFNYCCTLPLPVGGAGNFTNAPLFANEAGSNFRLQAGSPCIDAGNNSYNGANGLTDLDGNPRIWGAAVDMGAYEYSGPVIKVQPQSQTVYTGTNVILLVDASGRALHWQWWFDQTAIGDATNSTLLLTTVTTNEAGSYSVVITNTSGALTSQVAILAVLDTKPSITLQPVSQTVIAGSDMTFPADAVGSLPLGWQWQFNGAPIPAATGSSLKLTSIKTNQAGDYSVVVTNALGSATSRVAVLTVLAGLPPGTKYVWQNSPNPTVPYTNWATAAHAIQDAVDAGVAGDTIMVTNGAYPGGLLVGKPLALKGVNGAQFTIIDGGGTNRCVGMIDGASLSGFTLTNGSASWGGGASGGLLTNCVLAGNNAFSTGGGAQYCTLYNCTLTGNGGYLTNGSAAAYCTLYNCNITSNSGSGFWSAAVFVCNVYGCALTDNVVGGADTSTLYDCTVVGNQGGGAFASKLYNCIVYYNTTYGGPNYDGGTALNYCCTTPMPTEGIGNITNEPALARAWHLSSTSPCRGEGSPAYASGLDLDGQPWLNPPSIGCDEYYSSGSITGALSVASTALWTNVPTGFSAVFDGAITGNISGSRWEFGDGTVESNRLHTVHQWAAAGTYNVVLWAFNDDYPAGATATLTIQVVPLPVHYVDINSAKPIAPYTNWSTAARSIEDALASVSVPTSLVVVTNGTYGGGLTVAIPLTLVSVNGPQVTIIDGAGTNRCLSLITNATLSGFTLTNGFSTNSGGGGGVWCSSGNACLTNCLLVGNHSGTTGGGVQGGTLYDCTLTNNSAKTDGGGASASTLYNCRLTGNSTVDSGGGASSCVLANCLVMGNTANEGGGAFYSTIRDCTLAGNSAWEAGGAYSSWLYNCIVYDNEAQSDPNYNSTGWGSFLSYCCTTPIPGGYGEGNITNAPLFVDEANGNFHLQTTSPCINAGNNTYASGATDLDGNPRIVSGTVDIGAYEYQGKGSLIPYAWLQQYGLPIDGSADTADPDHDGMNNWQEWVCGTDPTNSQSVLRLLSVTATSNNVTLTWQSVPGVNYFLQRSADLGSPFTLEATNIVGLTTNIVLISSNSIVIATNIIGQASATTYTDTNTAGVFIYRVGVQHP